MNSFDGGRPDETVTVLHPLLELVVVTDCEVVAATLEGAIVQQGTVELITHILALLLLDNEFARLEILLDLYSSVVFLPVMESLESDDENFIRLVNFHPLQSIVVLLASLAKHSVLSLKIVFLFEIL
jgi:hypothetical protein